MAVYREQWDQIMISFITTFIPNPRINKRIEVAKEIDDVSVICARRKDADIYSSNFRDVKYFILDLTIPSHRSFYKRFYCFLLLYFFVSRQLRILHPQIIHVQGLDCLFIATLHKAFHHVSVVYEVADVREYLYSRQTLFFPFILKRLEVFLLKFISTLIVTSELFYNDFYIKYVSSKKVIFIPNVPNLKYFSSYNKKQHRMFTIGFIGAIRYLDQLKMLIDATRSLPVKVIFSGSGISMEDEKELIDYSKTSSNIEFTGKYVYKTDIAGLYEKVDCVYAVYNADNKNVQIALPNKLYESVYCELPIIVSSNTYLGKIVSEFGVGVAVSHKSPQELHNAIERMVSSPSYYRSIVNNCRKNKDAMLKTSSLDELKQTFISLLH